MILEKPIILDACCIINILASGRIEDIISNLPVDIFISETVKRDEILNIEHLEELNPPNKKFMDVLGNNTLKVVNFKNDIEMGRFIFYVMEIGDDGEAASLAIAEERNFILATDDKNAIKIANRYAKNVPIISTLELIKTWSEIQRPTKNCLQNMLKNIKEYGKYFPGDKHPLKQWWDFYIL
ncbi:MAG: hypothetical protein R3E32_11510 [Chitinophagales bacterium]